MQFPDFFAEELPEDGQITMHNEDVPMPEGLPDLETLTAWITAMASSENVPMGDLNYIFCSDEYLLEMNKKYLEHDYYTDVITFPMAENAVYGDVFISTERVVDNAKNLGVTARQELLRVMIHGALHLAGYGDKTPEEDAKMREKENYYLAALG